MEEYWLKYGFKENGELICVRSLSKIKPDRVFYYSEEGKVKEVKNSDIIKISQETIKNLKE